MARLSGTGLVADDLFLMAHDDVTGRPFLQPRALGLCLAGGLLAELTLPGRLGLYQGLVVAGNVAPPADQLANDLLGLVFAEHELHPLGEWLAFLARTAAADVAVRLVRAGYLQRAWSRRPRRAEHWVPVDPDSAFAPLGRARPALDVGCTSAYSAVLAGLAVAAGLGSRLVPYGPPDARYHLRQTIARLPASLRELVAQTQAEVDKAVLTHRVKSI